MTAQAEEQRDTDWGAGPVLEAAAALEVKEFDLFALAHRWWFGRGADARALERVFAAYMFAGAVPPWARHYAREILRELRSAAPDLTRLGLERPRAQGRPPRQARHILAAALVVFAMLYALVPATVSDPEGWATAPRGEAALSCQGGGPGLKFFEGLAYALSGRAPPACD
ncbi:MAG: hypothetical protein IIA34_12870 [Proteobacteria bacterium]|nr:hypothetical protein [Pseudomonadota bacterium]